MKRSRAIGVLILLVACKKNAPEPGDGGTTLDAALATIERSPEVEKLWTEAKSGDESDLARLADREGSIGLVERSVDARYRTSALSAMAFSEGFFCLPTLADVAKNGSESDAALASESAALLAANKRRQVDAEDAAEFREGCTAFLGIAKDKTRPLAVRISTVRALRMLSDQGCVNPGDIPTDVDVK